MSYLDISNQKFGILTAIRRLTEEEKENLGKNKKSTYWLCKCDCGNNFVALLNDLKNGCTKSCGCLKTNKAITVANARIGEKFEKLTIVGWHFEHKGTKRVKRKIVYDCVCECGGTASCEYHALTSGHTKSCGCLGRYYLQKQQEEKRSNLVGQTFGKLKVLRATDERDVTRSIFWECQCSCGTITKVTSHHLLHGMIQSCRCTNSRGEEKISEILSKRGIKFEKQYRFKDLLGEKNRPYFFDFAIKNEQDELAYLIEFDGEQHFSYKGEKGWATEERLVNQQNKDHKKNLYCFEHNIPLIRIPYKRFNKLNLEDLKLDTTKFLLTKEGEQKYVFENTPKRLRKDLVDNN